MILYVFFRFQTGIFGSTTQPTTTTNAMPFNAAPAFSVATTTAWTTPATATTYGFGVPQQPTTTTSTGLFGLPKQPTTTTITGPFGLAPPITSTPATAAP